MGYFNIRGNCVLLRIIEVMILSRSQNDKNELGQNKIQKPNIADGEKLILTAEISNFLWTVCISYHYKVRFKISSHLLKCFDNETMRQ
ncbi:rCG28804 [Rattus norvegicus]|uniref:RCG28804 n=1 Tax=Rattus norvegicus TaxID=10116 RepID=A6HVM8_RAT|nr:rCG28804 [Rattus norvegicus]